MLERNVRLIVGGGLIGSHLFTFLSLAYLTNAGGITPEQARKLIPVVLPLFTAYTTAVVKSIVSRKNIGRALRRRVSKEFGWLCVGLSTLFAVLIPGMLYLKAYNVIPRFEDFEFWFLGAETLLAAYLGLLIEPLYSEKASSRELSNP